MTRQTAAALQARRAYFTPAWFRQLFAGKLALADTFWIGHYGSQSALVPLGFFSAMIIQIVAPQALAGALLGFAVLQSAYNIGVTQAVIRVALGAEMAGGWRFAAIGFSPLHSGGAVLVAFLLLVG